MSYNLKEKLIQVTDEIKRIIEAQPGSTKLNTENYGWENYRYVGNRFRYGHVERYFVDGLLVVHITIFPHHNDAMPIFGFDIIGSQKTGKITGFFLDYTPSIIQIPFHNNPLWKNRTLPEWANMFSKDFIALRPEEKDYDTLFQAAISLFYKYIQLLNSNLYTTQSPTAIQEIIKAQNRYCDQQSKNERTLAAITKSLGKEKAETFMKEILFPKINKYE